LNEGINSRDAAIAAVLLAVIAAAPRSFGPSVASADAVPTIAHLSNRGNLTYSDREAFRRVLGWPDRCEEGFNYPDREFGGIYFYELQTGRYLAEVICTLGAYQGSQMFYSLKQERPGGEIHARLLRFSVLEERDDGGGLRLHDTTEPRGNAQFEALSKHVILLDRFRGFGDCGIWSTYAFRSTDAELVAARAKLACDGKDANRAERWPEVSPSVFGR